MDLRAQAEDEEQFVHRFASCIKFQSRDKALAKAEGRTASEKSLT